MKKLFAILVLALFVLSMVPAALAEPSIQIRPGKGRIKAITASAVEDAAEANASSEEPGENATPRPGLAAIKEKIKSRAEIAREKYQEAKERLVAARENYQEAKLRVREAKKAIAECVNGETEECARIRAQIKVHSKNFLLNTADRVLSVLDKLKARIEANEDLTDEQQAEMLADLDAKTEGIEDAKAVIEGLTNESTKQEIREAAQTIKQAWIETRAVMKRNAGRLVNEKIGGIIVQVEHVREKLDKIIKRLQSQGYEIQGIELIYADFDDELGKARENYEKAKDLFESGLGKDAAEAQDFMRQAHQHIKNAHQMLRNLVINIKGLKDGQRILETPVSELDEDEAEEAEREETEAEEAEAEEIEEETAEENATETIAEPQASVVVIGTGEQPEAANTAAETAE